MYLALQTNMDQVPSYSGGLSVFIIS